MIDELNNINNLIHKEADVILYEKGLLSILECFGTPHVTGSYALNLMTWRDLDIYLEAEDFAEESFFTLGKQINERFHPIKMSYRNERVAQTEGLPVGLYWGIYLGNERKGEWKIDLWVINGAECQKRLQFCDDIAARLTPTSRELILAIKCECWQDREYRRSYTSKDIYEAVLSEQIKNMHDFKEFLHKVRCTDHPRTDG
jgi:hypothetical protein